MSDCGRCGEAVEPNRGFVLYVSPDPSDTGRIVVHDLCIAEDVAAGLVERVSPFAFRKAPAPDLE